MEWHEKSLDEVFNELNSSRDGLSSSNAKKGLEKYGRNVIPERKKVTALEVFLEQFKNFLVVILIFAAIVSFALGELLDAAAILTIVILNAAFGFIQERKAEKTLEALRKFAVPRTKVVRNGTVQILDSPEVVPGDVIVLEVGDKVPADCRVIEEYNLKVNESILTGESTPVEKTTNSLTGKLAVADRKNMLFSGTNIVYGRCRAIAVGTGAKTEFGKIAKVLQQRKDPTPLQDKLEVLGKNIGIIVIIISVIIFIVGFLNNFDILQIFLTSVSLAVAAIPEGLPAVVTITLAIGLMKMVKKNAIIRKLPAVETLGSTTVICSDKTGTLTKNEMTVRKIYLFEKLIEVTGEGYSTKGKLLYNDSSIKDPVLESVLTSGFLCNNAEMGKDNVGDPTEIALLVSALKYGLKDPREKYKRISEIEFDSDRKMMSVFYDINGEKIMYTKGALEEILARCTTINKNGNIEPITQQDKDKILEANDNFSSEALRVLAFATKKGDNEEKDLTFLGLQGMIDPPRPEVKASIEKCATAGVKVVMITGDHKNTAVAIAKELGIMDDSHQVLTGVELNNMNYMQFKNVVDNVRVYARVSPEHKVMITEALKEKGHIVAVTGDGVNDAPALKKADIGVAMGIAGTDIAKEASDMVLTDDNFASIVSAVEEGRGIYDNIKKFVNYLLSCNIGEVIVVFAAILLSMPLPLLPLQLLFMNLIN